MPTFLKKNGKWAVRVSWIEETATGKKYPRRLKQGFDTKRQASEWANEFLYKVKSGQIEAHKRKIPTFSEYFKEWAEIYRFPHIRPATKATYNATIKELQNYFGVTKINKITRTRYQSFLNDYSSSHAPVTVAKVKALIKSCLDSAVADRLIPVNFSLGTEAKGNKERKSQVVYPTIEQIQAILNKAVEKRKPTAPTYYMIITAILTGMRIAEIGGMTWDNIDFENKTFKITRAFDFKAENMKHPFKPLKNDYSERTIRVNQSLLDMLEELKGNHKELVFYSRKFKRVPYSNGNKRTLKSILSDLNFDLGDFHFHSLRHCHVALLHHKGIEWYAISKRLGHKNLATTLKEYAYLADEDKIKNDNLIEEDMDSVLGVAKKVAKN